MKKRKKIIISIIVLSVIVVIILSGFALYKRCYFPRYANISIDDATIILQELALEHYDSIFEEPILASLKNMHDNYGIVCVLYIFYSDNGFSITEMPDKYKQEFSDSSDWLKIGFHWFDNENPFDNIIAEDTFELQYQMLINEVVRFAGEGSLARVLRLHCWYGTDEMISYLHEQGIEGVLCPDDQKTIGYNLIYEEQEIMLASQNGIYYSPHFSMTYFLTDVRIEQVDDVLEKLKENKSDRVMVLFTHANCYAENEQKVEEAVEWLSRKKYSFSFFERLRDIK